MHHGRKMIGALTAGALGASFIAAAAGATDLSTEAAAETTGDSILAKTMNHQALTSADWGWVRAHLDPSVTNATFYAAAIAYANGDPQPLYNLAASVTTTATQNAPDVVTQPPGGGALDEAIAENVGNGTRCAIEFHNWHVQRDIKNIFGNRMFSYGQDIQWFDDCFEITSGAHYAYSDTTTVGSSQGWHFHATVGASSNFVKFGLSVRGAWAGNLVGQWCWQDTTCEPSGADHRPDQINIRSGSTVYANSGPGVGFDQLCYTFENFETVDSFIPDPLLRDPGYNYFGKCIAV